MSGLAVWKFPLLSRAGFIDMPEGARVISAGEQFDTLCVWALCDPDAPKEPRYVTAINTGQRLPPSAAEFIGTVQTSNGTVWHLFEGTR